MAIPDFQTVLLPLLKKIADGREYTMPIVRQLLADEFDLSDSEKNELLPSGKQAIFTNRVAWAKVYLNKANLVESIQRGVFKITEQGLQVIKDDPKRIDVKFLQQFPSFQKFRTGKTVSKFKKDTDKTPIEQIEESFQIFRDSLAEEILENILECSATFFEHVVVELLVKMGYGGTKKDAGQAIGKSGDEGIDGVIKQDRLGLDIIYIQAKRWGKDHVVGRPEIQKFAGALQGKRSRKGVFMTTSSYTQQALDYAKSIESKIILIDGDQLAQLMIDFNLGVTFEDSFEIKKIDSDYFIEE